MPHPAPDRTRCLGEGFHPPSSGPHPYGGPVGDTWAWDANIDGGSVRVTLIGRELCASGNAGVDLAAHERAAAALPDAAARQLLSHSDVITVFEGTVKPGRPGRLRCLLRASDGALIHSSPCLPWARPAHPWSVRCPLPSDAGARARVTPATVELVDLANRSTPPLSICPPLPPQPESRRRGSIGICASVGADSLGGGGGTSSSSFGTSRLDEWLEHYRRLGVDQFFLFHQARGAGGAAVRRLASRDDMTLVDWPWQGCVTKGSGRVAMVDGMALRSFQRIEQWTALESCYRRFRHSVRWMLSVDVDEYITPAGHAGAVSAGGAAAGGAIAGGVSAAPLGYLRRLVGLDGSSRGSAVADVGFDAFSFRPMRMVRCPGRACLPGAASGAAHLGCFNQPAHYFPEFEHKQLMRTDAIVQFRVHYIVEPKAVRRARVPTEEALLLHFKQPGSFYLDSNRSSWHSFRPDLRLAEICSATSLLRGAPWPGTLRSVDDFLNTYVLPHIRMASM